MLPVSVSMLTVATGSVASKARALHLKHLKLSWARKARRAAEGATLQLERPVLSLYGFGDQLVVVETLVALSLRIQK